MWRVVPTLAIGFAALLFACASEQEGIEVTFELVPSSVAPTSTADGRTVLVQHASLALGSVELVSCDGAPNVRTSHAAGLGLLHTEGSPTLLGTTAVLALDGSGEPFALGALLPPPGRYCAIRQLFVAADTDALGLVDDADVGATVHVRATVADVPVTLRSEKRLEVETPIEPALELDLEGARSAHFQLGVADASQLFTGVSFTAGRETDDADVVLANLASLVSARRAP